MYSPECLKVNCFGKPCAVLLISGVFFIHPSLGLQGPGEIRELRRLRLTNMTAPFKPPQALE